MPIPFYISDAALWILVVMQGVVLLGLVKKVFDLQNHGTVGAGSTMTDGRQILGQIAPEFSAPDLSGAQFKTTDFAEVPWALLFVTSSCSSCLAALGDIDYLKHKADENVVVVCMSGQDDCEELAKKYELDVPMIVDENKKISDMYEVSLAPMTVLVDENNHISRVGHPEGPSEDSVEDGGEDNHVPLEIEAHG